MLSQVSQQQPEVFSLGCICHLAALCAAAALKKLPLSTDDLVIDIFYHFKHSSERCAEFAMVLDGFDGIAPVKVLKHCSTRWLSLEREPLTDCSFYGQPFMPISTLKLTRLLTKHV